MALIFRAGFIAIATLGAVLFAISSVGAAPYAGPGEIGNHAEPTICTIDTGSDVNSFYSMLPGYKLRQVAASAPQTVDYPRRGCCSHHGGVCGCADNRAVCCDGSLSPTCGCD